MSGETRRLAEYACALTFEDLPDDVVRAARNTIIDGVACCVFGARFPWSQRLIDYVASMDGAGGSAAVLAPMARKFHASGAALINGALAHAFELDAGTRKGVGAHPFGTVFTAALPVAQSVGASGRELLTAFVAGSEVMLRIGKATGRSNEHRGFHAPGTTGPFGAAVACALLYKLDVDGVLNAMGIAGSLASGLRQFSKSASGGMVKRLHFGRAAEGGVLAAGLAARGFDGPHDILEGQAGFLRVFCDHFDLDELTVGLDRSVFHMREVSMKRFGTHGSTQGPLQALLDIFSRRSATPGQIEWIDVEVSEDSLELHSGRAPADLMQAQYSIPFCVAIACVRDIEDPRSIGEDILDDPEVLRMLPKIRMKRSGYNEKRTCQVTVEFTDGAQLSSLVRDNAAAWKPASDDAVRRKYAALMRDAPADAATEKLERLEKLELQPNMDWLSIPPA
jgi:2-methylcitrate dehydratase PrpD